MLGCWHSPSISGGVARRGSRGNSESGLGAQAGVANVSHEHESQVGVMSEVVNVSRECESRV